MPSASARERSGLALLAQIGRCELLLPIGAGGNATVYLARSPGIGGFERDVALNLLHPHSAGETEGSSDLLEETRIAARVRHPNAVPVLEHFPFAAMASRILRVACAVATLFAGACPACRSNEAPAHLDADAASVAAQQSAEKALRDDLKSLNDCCIQMQDRWAEEGEPFIQASKRCVSASSRRCERPSSRSRHAVGCAGHGGRHVARTDRDRRSHQRIHLRRCQWRGRASAAASHDSGGRRVMALGRHARQRDVPAQVKSQKQERPD